jgi:hypothetical protein
LTRKFSISCDFGGQMSPFTICIGKPEGKHHPLHFQADWLTKERNGTIPPEVMDAITKLQELAKKDGIPLEDLCVYALGTEEEKKEMEKIYQEEDETASEADSEELSLDTQSSEEQDVEDEITESDDSSDVNNSSTKK